MNIAVTTPTGHVGSAVADFPLGLRRRRPREAVGAAARKAQGLRPPRGGNRHRRPRRRRLPRQGHQRRRRPVLGHSAGLRLGRPAGVPEPPGQGRRHGHPHQQNPPRRKPLVHRGELGLGRRPDQRPARRRRTDQRSRLPRHAPAAGLLLREPALATRLDPHLGPDLVARQRLAALSDDRHPRHRPRRRRTAGRHATGADTWSGSCTGRPT